MSQLQVDINLQDTAVALVDHRSGVARRIRALSDEPPRIGSFATGLANHEPRPWSGKQMVADRLRVDAVEAHDDRAPSATP